jgi:hypothetical protein
MISPGEVRGRAPDAEGVQFNIAMFQCSALRLLRPMPKAYIFNVTLQFNLPTEYTR